MDGPSAGIAMATAIASSILNIPVDHRLAMTGELSILGHVKPVGGVVAKVEAAIQAGANKVLMPQDNWQALFADTGDLQVIPVKRIEEVLSIALHIDLAENQRITESLYVGGEKNVASVMHAGEQA